MVKAVEMDEKSTTEQATGKGRWPCYSHQYIHNEF